MRERGALAHKDGSWHSLESTLVSLREDPVIEAILIVSRDVTERVALEQERERLELERRVSLRLEAVGQLAAGIAHEINTPLQYVGNSVRFLMDAVDDLLTVTSTYHEPLDNDVTLEHAEPSGERPRRRMMPTASTSANGFRQLSPARSTASLA